jgi:hypothetical protein
LQLSLDDVGELLRFCHHRGRFFAHHRRWGGRYRSFYSAFSSFTQGAEMCSNLVCKFVVKRAGMRLLLYP